MKKFYLYCDREKQIVYVEGRDPKPPTIASYRNRSHSRRFGHGAYL